MTQEQLHAFAEETLQQIENNTTNQLSPAKLGLIKSKKSLQPLQVNVQIQHALEPTVTQQQKHAEFTRQETNAPIAADLSNLSNLTDEPLPQGLEILSQQLAALGITSIQRQAREKISAHLPCFTDGLILNHLPFGFSVETTKAGEKVLAFNPDSTKPPSAFMPNLNHQAVLPLPEPITTKEGLIASLQNPSDKLLKAINTCELRYIPILSQVIQLGGNSYGLLFLHHLQTLKLKKITLDFLTLPHAAMAFTTPKGMRHLQKLAKLKTVEQLWWNKLVDDHKASPHNTFDFNSYFEIYTTVFLPKLSELGITLPNTPPKKPIRHMLTALARMYDVLERAQDKHAQCQALPSLDWGPLGANYAMAQRQFKQVTAEMQLGTEHSYRTLDECATMEIMSVWCHQYAGQHWNAKIHLEVLINKIQELDYTDQDKKNLLYILTITAYAHDDNSLSTKDLLHSQQTITKALQSLTQAEISACLQHLSQCEQFKPVPGLHTLTQLLTNLLDLKKEQPTQDFIAQIVEPICFCLKTYDARLLSNLMLRKNTQLTLSFVQALKETQPALSNVDFVLSLSCLEDHNCTRADMDAFSQIFSELPDSQRKALFATLAQIDIQKSKTLPNITQVKTLITQLLADPSLNTSKLISKFIKQQTPPVLGDCVIGSEEVEALDTSLGAVIKDFFRKYDYKLSQRLDEYIQACIKLVDKDADAVEKAYERAKVTPIIHTFQALEQKLQNTDNISFDNLGPELSALEKALKNFFEARVIKLPFFGEITGQYIFNAVIQGSSLPKVKDVSTQLKQDAPEGSELRRLLNAFEASPVHSLSVLFKDEIIKRLKTEIQGSLNQLGTQATSPEFNAALIKSLEQLDTSVVATIGLKQYDQHIEDIKALLNALISTKNADPEHFYTHFKTFTSSALRHLPYALQTQLFSTLTRASQYLPIESTLPQLINVASQDLPEFSTPPSAGQKQWFAGIERVVNGLAELIEILPTLQDKPETQQTLFKMSVAHNFRSAKKFPLAEIKALQDLEFKHKPEILAALMSVLKKLTADTDSALIDTMLGTTASLLSTNPNHEILTELLSRLLTRIQPDVFDTAAEKDKLEEDLKAYNGILEEIKQPSPDTHVETLLNILNKLSNSNQISLKLSTLSSIKDKLQHREIKAHLGSIVALFNTEPYPNAEALLSVLTKCNAKTLLDYCEKFELNPLATAHTPRDLGKHFTTQGVQAVLEKLKDLSSGQVFDLETQVQLATKIVYLDCLGTEAGRYTDINGDLIQKPLTEFKREELKDQATRLRDSLRILYKQPMTEARRQKQETQELQLLAVLRESYFRTSGNEYGGFFPNTSQMLSLLLSLQYPDNLLMQIRTGEGKSLISPMLAALQWMREEGGQVDLLTANMKLLEQGYEKNYRRFFSFLGIDQTIITKDSKPNSYQRAGINCSTPEDMMFYRLAAERRHEVLDTAGKPNNVIIDECDDVLFTQIRCNLVSGQCNAPNPYAWIYPHVRDFIKLPTYQNTGEGAWTEAVDIEQLRAHLSRQATDITHHSQLSKIEDPQLQQWLDAACTAEQLELDKHFIIKKVEGGEDNECIAIPLVQGTPKPGCSFADEIQPALHARLQAEYVRDKRSESFKISAYPPVVSSQSIRGFLKQYKGRLLGISGTPGDQTELQSLASLYGTHAISLPPHRGNTRETPPDEFSHNQEQTFECIKKIIQSIQKPVTEPEIKISASDRKDDPEHNATLHEKIDKAYETWLQTQTQPVLIITQSPKEARALQKALEKPSIHPLEIFQFGHLPVVNFDLKGIKVQMITGEESDKELDIKLQLAGQPNTITISTKLIGRGIDIDPGNHPEGLRVIQTYVEIERDAEQIAGRSARNGKPGVSQRIYQIQPPKNVFKRILYYFSPHYRNYHAKVAVRKLQDELTKQETAKRVYVQAIGLAQSSMMQQFDEWEKLLLSLNPKLASELMVMRSELLQASQRFQKKGVSKESLKKEKEIERFQTLLCQHWEAFKKDTLMELAKKESANKSLSFEQQLHLDCLPYLLLSEELKVQTKIYQQSELLQTATKDKVQQSVDLTLQDRAGAILRFDPPNEAEAKAELVLQQAYLTLPRLIEQFSALDPQIKALFPTLPVLNTIDELKTTLRTLMEAIPYEAAQNADNLSKHFRRQGLIRAIHALFKQFLPNEYNEDLQEQEEVYTQYLMVQVAEYLCSQLSWAVEEPQSFHAKLERHTVKAAAKRLHGAAEALLNQPTDAQAQSLYKALQEEQLVLKDLFILSIGHKNTRNLVQESIAAIDALHHVPQFENKSRAQIHDEVLVHHHLQTFDALLKAQAPKVASPVWNHLVTKIEALKTALHDQTEYSMLLELRELLNRFSQYEAYKTKFKKPIQSLQAHLDKTIKTLAKKLSSVDQISENKQFMQRHAAAFKHHLAKDNAWIPNSEIQIQSGHDGIEQYVEVRIEPKPTPDQHNADDAVPILADFTGYVSPILADLKAKKEARPQPDPKINRWQTFFNADWINPEAQAQLRLSFDGSLPATLLKAFERIQSLKEKQDWDSNDCDEFYTQEEAKNIKEGYARYHTLKDTLANQQYELAKLQQEESRLNTKRKDELNKTPALSETERQLELSKLNPVQEGDDLDELKNELSSYALGGIFHPEAYNRLKAKIAVLELLKAIRETSTELSTLSTQIRNSKTTALRQFELKHKQILKDLIEKEEKSAKEKSDHNQTLLDDMIRKEKEKSPYQVKRFFGPDCHAQLLAYQAKHVDKEEKEISELLAAAP